MEKILPLPPGPDALRSLLDKEEGLRISIYVPLPDSRGFDEIHDFPASYELAAKSAVKKMVGLGASKAQAEAALSRLLAVNADVASLPNATESLAVYWGPGGLKAFALASRAERHTHVGQSYHVRPLLQAARQENPYRVLALSPNRVSLFEGDARNLQEVKASNMPKNLKEALGSELSKGTLQYHSSSHGGDAVIFHGQADTSHERAIDQERFHRMIGHAVAEFWEDREDPLVLATEPGSAASLCKLVDLPGLLERSVVGNPDRLTPRELHGRTWPIVKTWAAGQQARASQRAHDALGHGLAVSQLDEVIELATAGRVRRLWLDAHHEEPGRVDLSTGRLIEQLGDEDVLDELAALVTAKGGDVIVCKPEELPDSCTVVAELRG